MKLLLVFGAPNCGKGTFLEHLASCYHVHALGTGDVCREEKKKKSKFYLQAQAHMTSTGSTLWPTEPLMSAFNERFTMLARHPRGTLVLDGFPRTEEQNPHLIQLAQSHQISEALLVYIKADDQICITRAENRGREDDLRIRERLSDFHAQSLPALHNLMAEHNVFPLDKLTYDGNKPKEDNAEYCTRFCEGLAMTFGLRKRTLVSAIS